MADKTKIQWADATWTPLQARRRDTGKTGVHCVKVSPECKNCYAERFNKRGMPAHGTGLPFTVLSTEKVEMFLNPGILEQPFKWKRPRTIFVCSQTDLFGEFAPDELIDRVFTVMALCPQHRFLVLTKRAERMQQYCSSNEKAMLMAGGLGLAVAGIKGSKLTHTHVDDGLTGFSLQNVWLGVTAGTQATADERIPWLLRTPAEKRFISAEPLLEAVDLVRHLWMPDPHGSPADFVRRPGIDWVIAGGESGPGARPMHPDWARSLRDQCVAAGTAFHFKQWGEWVELPEFDCYSYGRMAKNNTEFNRQLRRYAEDNGASELLTPGLLLEGIKSGCILYDEKALGRVGKRAAGRLLDGREWNEVPDA